MHYIKSEEDSIVDMALFDSAIIQDLLIQYRLRQAKLTRHYPIPECFAKIHQEISERQPFLSCNAANLSLL